MLLNCAVRAILPRLEVGSMREFQKLELGWGSTLEARAQLRLEENGLVSPLEAHSWKTQQN